MVSEGYGDGRIEGYGDAPLRDGEDHPLWEPVEWTLPGASPLSGGAEPFPGILCCDDPHSPRCGTLLAHGITREQHTRLARALGTWPAP
ncbi:hypothetical protein [Streptomyces sp. NPDC048659]|uniref:hypothetical protein n=1 Tax=Streptomyces sp. NPDC048659 TaxID=3155489 RepID=UPI00341996D9